MNRTADQPEPNPLREGLSARPIPQPCSIVIFGATGDLTHRKLVPALYNLAADGELPPGVVIVGFARRDKSDDDFRRDIEESTRKFSRQPVRDEIWNAFAQSIFYHRSEFGDEAGYEQLAKRLDELDKSHGTRGMKEEEMLEIAELAAEALDKRTDEGAIESVRKKVIHLTSRFPLPI